MLRRMIELAVRHRNAAWALIAAGIAAPAVLVALAFGGADVALRALFAGLPACIGVTMLGWGIVLLGSWFGPPRSERPRRTTGVGGFAARAFDGYLAVFLTLWLVIAFGLVGWSVVALMRAP